MILTLTANPALDVTCRLDRLTPGATHRVTPVAQRAGGKGVNVASVLTLMGISALALGPVGGPTGSLVLEDLDRRGVPHLLTEVESETRRTLTLVPDDGEATVLNEPGRLDPGDWDRVLTVLRDRLHEARVLVLSGSLPEGAPEDAYARAVRLARAVGVETVVDTAGPALLAAVQAGPDVIKPNRDELAATTGTSDVLDGAHLLQSRGAGAVLVSCGEHGVVAVGRDGQGQRVAPRESLRGNATGAGDAMVAGVAAGLADGLTLTRLLPRAVAWSVAAVHSPVAGEVDPRLAERITVTTQEVTG